VFPDDGGYLGSTKFGPLDMSYLPEMYLVSKDKLPASLLCVTVTHPSHRFPDIMGISLGYIFVPILSKLISRDKVWGD
jgi:hypothetical protein